MSKLILPLVALLSIAMVPPNDPVPTITLTGTPWKQGTRCKGTFTGPVGSVLYFDWDPPGEPPSAVVGANGEWSVLAPSNATSVIVTGGGAAAAGTVVVP